MKKLQLLAVALSMLAIGAGQNPIRDSYLQNDLDANDKALINLKNQAPLDVWISNNRSDGKGRGTQIDPYDGSTRAKLDTLWPQLVNGTATGLGGHTPVRVTFAPSQTAYLSNGMLLPISNCTISYAGATLKLDVGAAVTDQKRGFFANDYLGTTHNCIFDGGGTGVIDCNGANQAVTSSICLFGINVWGASNKILGTEFIHFCTTNAGAESFVSALFAAASGATGNNEIAHNEYTSPALVSTGPITLYVVAGDDTGTNGYPGPRWTFGDEIHHNFAHDIHQGSFSNGFQAGQGGAGSVGQNIHDNLTMNSDIAALHSDTGHTWNMTISRNTGINIPIGIHLVVTLENLQDNGHTWHNLTVEDNAMMIVPGNPSYAYIQDEGPFPGATYRNNRVDRYGSSGLVQDGFLFRGATNGKFEHNIAGPNITAPVIVGDSTDSTISGNTYESAVDEGTNSNVTWDGNLNLAGQRINSATDRANIGIYKVTQAASGPAITFLNIPSGYKRIRLTTSLRGSSSAGSVAVKVTFNGDTTSNYSWNMNKADGTNSFSNEGGSASDTSIMAMKISDALCPGSLGGVYDFVIPAYDDANFAKVITGQGMYYDSVAASRRETVAGMWFNSVPITSLTLTAASGNLTGTATLSGD